MNNSLILTLIYFYICHLDVIFGISFDFVEFEQSLINPVIAFEYSIRDNVRKECLLLYFMRVVFIGATIAGGRLIMAVLTLGNGHLAHSTRKIYLRTSQ